ncbi:hypothetical protein [Leptospira stimsonii]|uniref:hypothetical protein n=1 Tax=Leptospira stimsonii TaxID=2202203 RepID=UPI0019D670D7|nr:hypothetical protein [Leptospira stimsonii]
MTNLIDEIREKFNIRETDVSKVKAKLREKIKKLHPDKNLGELKGKRKSSILL